MQIVSLAETRCSPVVLRSVTVVDLAPMAPKTIWKPHWGTIAQWTIFVVAFMTWYLNHSKGAARSADEHVNALISAKLDPAVSDINNHTDKLIDPINISLSDLTRRVGDVEGQLQMLRSGHIKLEKEEKRLSDRVGQQEALNRLQAPRRILAVIRAEIQIAESRNTALSASKLADYRSAIHALPASTANYWVTVAAIINYQSLLNQKAGEAPDPSKISQPCLGVTSGASYESSGNVFIGVPIVDCIVDLDTEKFANVTFEDSVVRYHGGPVSLTNVRFVNCRFILDLPAGKGAPAHKDFLLALLDSPGQRDVRIPG